EIALTRRVWLATSAVPDRCPCVSRVVDFTRFGWRAVDANAATAFFTGLLQASTESARESISSPCRRWSSSGRPDRRTARTGVHGMDPVHRPQGRAFKLPHLALKRDRMPRFVSQCGCGTGTSILAISEKGTPRFCKERAMRGDFVLLKVVKGFAAAIAVSTC